MKKIDKHLFIPDCQIKEGVPLEHLKWIGQYIVKKKPDVIVCIGDFADMPSLSSYDKCKKSFDGRRYKKDIAAARKGMNLLLQPLKEYNEHQKYLKAKQYKPRMVMTLGNHEERIMRAVESSPELDGVIGYHDLPYEDWEVHDFLKPVWINGVCYVHYMANPMTGKPYSGLVSTILKQVGHSFVTGHAQKLDVATRHLTNGVQQWGLICGACYQHDEDYKGYQGNNHFRGIAMLHRVIDGSFDPCFISLDYLRDTFGEKDE
jgi:hypothetical protein